MTEKIFKRYQSYFERDGKEVPGIVITAKNKKSARVDFKKSEE